MGHSILESQFVITNLNIISLIGVSKPQHDLTYLILLVNVAHCSYVDAKSMTIGTAETHKLRTTSESGTRLL